MNPSVGWVLRVNLAQRIPTGHEQEGLRPVIVVGLPSLAGQPRYPVIVVVPLRGFYRTWEKSNAKELRFSVSAN